MKAALRSLILSILAFVYVPAGVLAAETPAAEPDAVLERASDAVARKDWPAAQGLLREGLQQNPGNADYHNLYAYALRKGANPDMSLVFKHYGEALRIDPKHRGAHEYIGEAYLMVGNVGKAKEHLVALDKICFLRCEEYGDLKKAIADYESRQAAR
jgi:tetratricopeptide (TPR) repeat protein